MVVVGRSATTWLVLWPGAAGAMAGLGTALATGCFHLFLLPGNLTCPGAAEGCRMVGTMSVPQWRTVTEQKTGEKG